MLYKRHVFGETSKKCLSFFVGEFIAPEGSWEDDFRNLAFGMFFKVWKVKKTSIDWSRHGHNCAPVISEAIAISRRVGKILENRIEWKKPVGCLRLGNHLLPSDMKLNMGFINKPLEGILLLTMEGNKGVSFSILNWWHGEKIKTSCVFCFNPCFFGKIDKPTNFWWESRFVTLLGTNISHLGKMKIIFKSTFWGDMLVARRGNFLYPRHFFSTMVLLETGKKKDNLLRRWIHESRGITVVFLAGKEQQHFFSGSHQKKEMIFTRWAPTSCNWGYTSYR